MTLFLTFYIDMGHIAEMIEEGNVENDLSQRLKHYKKVLRVFLRALMDINPTDMLAHTVPY